MKEHNDPTKDQEDPHNRPKRPREGQKGLHEAPKGPRAELNFDFPCISINELIKC
jgi:hypothetical protein